MENNDKDKINKCYIRFAMLTTCFFQNLISLTIAPFFKSFKAEAIGTMEMLSISIKNLFSTLPIFKSNINLVLNPGRFPGLSHKSHGLKKKITGSPSSLFLFIAFLIAIHGSILKNTPPENATFFSKMRYTEVGISKRLPSIKNGYLGASGIP